MKKLFNMLCTVGLAFLMAFGLTNPVYAAEDGLYHAEDYEIVSGKWKMDNRHGHNQHVNLYMMIEDNANYTMYEQGYDFFCLSNLTEGDQGVFKWENGTLNAMFSYDFLAANGTEVTTIGDSTVYKFTFGVLPGNYIFAPCDGNSGTQMGDSMITLTDNLCHPGVGFGYYAESPIFNPEVKDEIITIEAGKDHNLYVCYGSTGWAWQDEDINLFIDWAKEHKAEYANANDGSGETETIVETPVVEEEPTLSFGGNTEEEETITTPDTETTTEVTTPEVVEKESNFGWLWIVGIIVVAVVAIVVMKKRK